MSAEKRELIEVILALSPYVAFAAAVIWSETHALVQHVIAQRAERDSSLAATRRSEPLETLR